MTVGTFSKVQITREDFRALPVIAAQQCVGSVVVGRWAGGTAANLLQRQKKPELAGSCWRCSASSSGEWLRDLKANSPVCVCVCVCASSCLSRASERLKQSQTTCSLV